MFPRVAEGFRNLEAFKVVLILSQTPSSYAGICNVRLRPGASERDLKQVAGFTNVQLLSKETDGSLTIFTEGRPMREWLRPRHPRDGYHFPPFELEGDRWRMTFLGTEAQVRRNLAILEERGLHYRVVYSGDARFAPESVLSGLTAKQRKVILAAYTKGYFDFPRRIKSVELADSLGIAQSTLAQHIRKAEKRILDYVTQSGR